MFILRVLLIILDIFYWLIIMRVITSFLPLSQNIPPAARALLRILYDTTEPILAPIRNYLPRNQMGIDFSPLIVILLLFIIRRFLFLIFLG